MPVNFAGDVVWREFIVGPQDGEEASALTVSDMGVLLADRTQYLRAAANDGWHKQVLSPSLIAEFGGNPTWEFDPTILGWVYQDTNTTRIWFPAHLPPKGAINGMRILRNGNGSGGSGHVGLPADMPEYRLHYKNVVTLTSGTLVDEVDPAPGVAQYEADPVVPLEFVVAPFEIEEGTQFWIEIQGEGGANALEGLLFLYGIEILVLPLEVT